MHGMGKDIVEDEIIKRMNSLREARGWNKSRLASEIGLTRQIIHNWYASRTRPGGSEILSMARAFGVSVSYLFGETDDPRPAPAWRADEGAARTDRALALLEETARVLRGET